ncbi:MAG: SAF domain-containing protein, partial [Bryobacteraceae bacterium]
MSPEGAGPGARDASGFAVRERIPQAHKIALGDIESGAPVLRYGHVIGYANRPLDAGAWVREEFLDMPAPP